MKHTIDFEDIRKYGPQRFEGEITLTDKELDRPDEVETLGPVKVDITADIAALAGEFDVTGSVAFTADLRCSRCLDPFPVAMQANFHIRFVPRSSAPGGGEEAEHEISGDELEVEYYSDPSVSLREIAAEQVQLSLPMKPLCTEKCVGLCPQCGANRNRSSCSCEEAQTDERWGALRGIREELAKKQEN